MMKVDYYEAAMGWCDEWQEIRGLTLDIRARNDFIEHMRLRSIDPSWDEYYLEITSIKPPREYPTYIYYIDNMKKVWEQKDNDRKPIAGVGSGKLMDYFGGAVLIDDPLITEKCNKPIG